MIKRGEIKGVIIKYLVIHQDDEDIEQNIVEKGFLIEIFKSDDLIMSEVKQSNYTVANPGTIKAFHKHQFQDDLWFFTRGSAVVVLHDFREDSKTHGLTEIIRVEEHERKSIFIPRGVAHGYKVTSKTPCELVYFVNQLYNPDDEIRIDPNDDRININWDLI